MNPLRSLLGGPVRLETKVIDASVLTWSALLAGAFSSKAGVPVSTDTALQVSTVWACMRVLGDGIAQIPLRLYRSTPTDKRDADGDPIYKRRLAVEHPLDRVLWRRPNDFSTSYEWRETAMFHATLSKGAFAFVNRLRGQVVEIIPIAPSMVQVLRDWKYNVAYQISDGLGNIATLPRDKIFCLRGPSWDGVHGMEVVQQAREAIGLAIAAEEAQSRLHSNGTRPSGIITTDQTLSDEQIARIKTQWQAYSGVVNTGKIPILDIGLKFQQMQMTGVDAQTMDIRKQQVHQICSIFRVHPQMIGAMEKSPTYASAEQFFTAHMTHTLGPWVERWEQVIMRDLLSEEEVKDGFHAVFAVQALLRGDAKSRAEYLASGIVNGWMTRNEAREFEYLDPLAGLEKPLQPLNMQSVSEAVDAAVEAKLLRTMPYRLSRGEEMKLLVDAVIVEMSDRFGANLQEHPRLEGKVEEKVGRVLTAMNERRLSQVRDLITDVLEQVQEAA